jgi:cytochrome P450
MSTARLDVNLFERSVIDDPHPVYEQIRAAGRLVWNEYLHGWMITGFDDAATVLTDDGSRFAIMNGDPELIFWFDALNMIQVDGAEHHRLRGPFVQFFTRSATAAWEQRVSDVVDELLAPLVEGRESFDVIADFTMIPTVIVAEMLGVPPDRYEDFRRWSHQIVSNLAYGNEQPETREIMRGASAELNEYLSEEIERHRREQPDDLLTAMLRTSADITPDEVRSAAILLLIAGYDTTAKLMSTSLVALERHPDTRRRLVEDPSLIPAAIEEILRWTGVSQMTPRQVVQDTVLAGHELSAGEIVFVLFAAANRDPERWPDPARFDIDREPRAHVGFGYGPHLCLGAPLARLETKIALERLLRVAPEYHLTDVDFGTAFFVRGPETGTLEVGVASGAA